MRLRDYQVDLVRRTGNAFRSGHRRVLMQLPTGGGKTAIAAEMAKAVVAAGGRVLFLAHRIEILEQAVATLSESEMYPHVLRSGKSGINANSRVLASSIAMWHRHGPAYEEMGFEPRLMIVDEAHHVRAKMWEQAVLRSKSRMVLGLTATPERLDGRPLNHVFESLLSGPSISDLIQSGWLCEYRVFTSRSPIVVSKTPGKRDYSAGELSEIAEQNTERVLVSDPVAQYKQHMDGRPTIAYCCSIRHSERVVKAFRSEGIEAVHVDGKTPAVNRARIMQSFREGDIRVLSNVDLISEGYDCPGAYGVLMLRPTESLALYLQQVGRVLRPGVGKVATIIDHAQNVHHHGVPCLERFWTLSGKLSEADVNGSEERERTAAIATCPPPCMAIYEAFKPRCPECGKEREVSGRIPKAVEAELQELDIQEARRAKRDEQSRRSENFRSATRATGVATSLKEIQLIAKAHGYQPGWAYRRYRFIARKRPWQLKDIDDHPNIKKNAELTGTLDGDG